MVACTQILHNNTTALNAQIFQYLAISAETASIYFSQVFLKPNYIFRFTAIFKLLEFNLNKCLNKVTRNNHCYNNGQYINQGYVAFHANGFFNGIFKMFVVQYLLLSFQGIVRCRAT